MRWIDAIGASNRRAMWACGLACLLMMASAAPSAEEKRLLVFTEKTSYAVSVLDRDGREYVPLGELLLPLGGVNIRQDGRKIKVQAGNAEAEFTENKDEGRVRGNYFQLNARLLLENGRALIPLSSAPTLMTALLNTRADYHEDARRLIVGNSATRFTLELRQDPAPSLVVRFSAPVNPSINSEPGGNLKLVFTRDALTSSSSSWKFESPLLSSATYSEAGGMPQMTISGTEPLLATFSDNGRTLTITAAPRLANAPATPPSRETPPQLAAPIAAIAPAPAAATPAPPAPQAPEAFVSPMPRQHYLVVIDASHGGDESGEQITPKLPEKDVTLALARRVRTELQGRGLNTVLLRDNDATLTLEQRAVAANSMHAAVYITLHADAMGSGVRVYTSMLTGSEARTAGAFLPWETAQSEYVVPSRALANAVLQELVRTKLPVTLMPAPVRPLNNVAAAAIAVEVAPQRRDLESLNNAAYQQNIAVAVATAVVAARPKLEASR